MFITAKMEARSFHYDLFRSRSCTDKELISLIAGLGPEEQTEVGRGLATKSLFGRVRSWMVLLLLTTMMHCS